MQGCDTLGSRLKYVEGHYHCNKIVENNTGFVLGKQGQRTKDFDAIIDCFKTNGYSQCTHYAQVWMEEPLSATTPRPPTPMPPTPVPANVAPATPHPPPASETVR